jgi:hypothetical protein
MLVNAGLAVRYLSYTNPNAQCKDTVSEAAKTHTKVRIVETHGALSVLHGRLCGARSPGSPKREMAKSHESIQKRSLVLWSYVEEEQQSSKTALSE